jgi:hypothetical protein
VTGAHETGSIDTGSVETGSPELESPELESPELESPELESLETGGLVTSPWEDALAGSAPDQLSLVELARMVGGYRWVEFRIFEVLGAWMGSETQTEARLMFDIQSRQHAWHAQLWTDLLPSVDGVVDPDLATSPPGDGLEELFATLGGAPAGAAAGGGTLLRLVGLARVVFPRVSAGYSLHLRRAVAVSDSAVVRALRLALRDETEAWQTTELMVQSLIRRPHDVEVVTAHQQRLESLVAGTGPGLVAWPEYRQH